MSTTFSCPEGPSTFLRVPCTSPAMGLQCTAEEPCGYCDKNRMCDEPSYEQPWCNFSVGSTLLSLLGLPPEQDGVVEAKDAPMVLQRILRVLNVDGDRAHLVEEGDDEGVGRHGCHVISGGCSDEQTVRRLTELQSLFSYAAKNGYRVVWN